MLTHGLHDGIHERAALRQERFAGQVPLEFIVDVVGREYFAYPGLEFVVVPLGWRIERFELAGQVEAVVGPGRTAVAAVA